MCHKQLCFKSSSSSPSVKKKAPKYSVGPPTSSASLLAYAPPLPPAANYLVQGGPGGFPGGTGSSGGSSNNNDSSRSSALDPLIPSQDSLDMSQFASMTAGGPPPMYGSGGTLRHVPEFPRASLKFVEMIGEGQFGEVFIVYYRLLFIIENCR